MVHRQLAQVKIEGQVRGPDEGSGRCISCFEKGPSPRDKEWNDMNESEAPLPIPIIQNRYNSKHRSHVVVMARALDEVQHATNDFP